VASLTAELDDWKERALHDIKVELRRFLDTAEIEVEVGAARPAAQG
jgi:hypothetical protein